MSQQVNCVETSFSYGRKGSSNCRPLSPSEVRDGVLSVDTAVIAMPFIVINVRRGSWSWSGRGDWCSVMFHRVEPIASELLQRIPRSPWVTLLCYVNSGSDITTEPLLSGKLESLLKLL